MRARKCEEWKVEVKKGRFANEPAFFVVGQKCWTANRFSMAVPGVVARALHDACHTRMANSISALP